MATAPPRDLPNTMIFFLSMSLRERRKSRPAWESMYNPKHKWVKIKAIHMCTCTFVQAEISVHFTVVLCQLKHTSILITLLECIQGSSVVVCGTQMFIEHETCTCTK